MPRRSFSLRVQSIALAGALSACSNDDGARSPSPEAGAGSGGESTNATGGGMATGGTASGNSGGRNSGAGGANGGAGNGGKVGDASAGGDGQAGGAPATGGVSGGSGGAGGTAGSGGTVATGGTGGGGTGRCTGSSLAVCVDVARVPTAFLDADGAVLAEGMSPIEYVLPAGGMVLTSTSLGTALHLDVPAGTVISSAFPPPPLTPTDVQDIQIDVPAPPGGQTVMSGTGCLQQNGAARELVGTGIKTFQMTTACLDGGAAAVFVSAGNAYMYVSGITLGAASLAPKVVALPAWKTVASPVQFELTSIPAGFDAIVTYRPRWGQGELSNGSFGVNIASGTGTASVTYEPGIGKEWRRFVQVVESVNAGKNAFTVGHASAGYPLPAKDSVGAASDLLPMAENIQISGRTVSWTLPRAATGADRVLVNVVGPGTNGDGFLRVVGAPSRTSVKVPQTLPSAFASEVVTSIRSVGVLLEDLPSVQGYAASLGPESFVLQFPGEITDPIARQSFRLKQ